MLMVAVSERYCNNYLKYIIIIIFSIYITVLTYDLAQRNKVTAPPPRVLSLACMVTTRLALFFNFSLSTSL